MTGELTKVIARNDALDGKTVQSVGIGYEQIDGDAIAMLVSFTDNSRGIYLATYPVDRLGDLDADGDIDFTDADLFTQVLLGSPADPAHAARADMNDDGAANGRDLPMFAEALFDG